MGLGKDFFGYDLKHKQKNLKVGLCQTKNLHCKGNHQQNVKVPS